MNTANTAASSASTSATSASTSASNASKSEIAAKAAQTAAEKARDDANSAVNKLTGVMKYAGQVDNYSDLTDVTKNKGDVWNIVNADNAHGVKAGDNVVWNGTDWDNLSGYVDLSSFAQKDDYQKVITSATANGATITFNHKDGTTSTATVNNVASATAATNDAKGQKIDATYEKIADASNVHTSLQNSINSLSTGKQDKLTFDTTPIADSTNPVISGGVKTYVDNIKNTLNTAISKKADSTDIVQSDWNVTDTTSKAFIKNKPSIYPNAEKIATNGDERDLIYATMATNDVFRLRVGGSPNEGWVELATGDDASEPIYVRQYSYLTGAQDASFGSIRREAALLDASGNTSFPGTVTAPNFTGLASKATADAAGNDIQNTYAKKTDLSSSVSTTSLTVSGATSVPTANQGNSSNAIASTEFVAKSISALVNGAPEQLNTLNELATALGNDSNFSATITAELGKKLDESEASDTYVTKALWQSSQNDMKMMLYQFTNQLQRNKTYSVGDIAYSPLLPPWAYLECITAGTTGDKEPDFSSVSSTGGNS